MEFSASLLIGVAGFIDARRQRDIVQRLLQHQSETIQNLHGFLLGMKVSPEVNLTQLNDRLEFIKHRAAEFENISKGKA